MRPGGCDKTREKTRGYTKRKVRIGGCDKTTEKAGKKKTRGEIRLVVLIRLGRHKREHRKEGKEDGCHQKG